MTIFFAWVGWIMLVFRVFGDIFRQRRSSGWTKAAWSLFVIVIPFLGVLIYLIANGRGMSGRDIEQSRAAQGELDDYVKSVAGASEPAAEIDRAKKLLDDWTINATEYDALKAKVMA
jgi:hypothetical protein